MGEVPRHSSTRPQSLSQGKRQRLSPNQNRKKSENENKKEAEGSKVASPVPFVANEPASRAAELGPATRQSQLKVNTVGDLPVSTRKRHLSREIPLGDPGISTRRPRSSKQYPSREQLASAHQSVSMNRPSTSEQGVSRFKIMTSPVGEPRSQISEYETFKQQPRSKTSEDGTFKRERRSKTSEDGTFKGERRSKTSEDGTFKPQPLSKTSEDRISERASRSKTSGDETFKRQLRSKSSEDGIFKREQRSKTLEDATFKLKARDYSLDTTRSVIGREQPDLPMIFALFLGMEILNVYTFICSMYTPDSLQFLRTIYTEDKDIQRQLIINSYCRYFGPWMGLTFSYFATNYVGQKLVLFFSILTGILCPVANLLSVILSSTSQRKFFILMSPITAILYYGSESFRKAIMLEQLKYPDQREKIQFYVFCANYMTYFGILLAKVMITITENIQKIVVANIYFCLFLYIMSLTVLVKVNDKIISRTADWRLIDKYFITGFKSIFYEEYKAREMSKKTKHFWNLFILCTTFVFFGSAYRVVIDTSFLYQGPLLPFEVLDKNIDTFCWYIFVILIAAPIGEFVILPLLGCCQLVKTKMHCLGLAYMYIIFAVISCCILEYNMSRKIGKLPLSTASDLRLYNVLDSEVLCSSDAMKYPVVVKPNSPFNIYGIELDSATKTITMNISIANFTLEQTYYITVRRASSHSCIISEKGLTAIREVDPIPLGPPGTNNFILSRVFVISDIVNLKGSIIFNTSKSQSTDFSFPRHQDTSIFALSPGSYYLTFKTKDKMYDLKKNVILEKGGVYVLIIYEYKKNNKTDVTLTYYNLLLPANIEVYWIFPQLIFSALAEFRVRVSGETIILTDRRLVVRNIFLIYFYSVTELGIGIAFKERTPYSYLVACGFASGVGLLLFIYTGTKI